MNKCEFDNKTMIFDKVGSKMSSDNTDDKKMYEAQRKSPQLGILNQRHIHPSVLASIAPTISSVRRLLSSTSTSFIITKIERLP